MKILPISKTFPAWHPRRGEPTGFAEKILSGEKIHTLRENKGGYYKDGDIVSIRQWPGKPYERGTRPEVIRDGVRIGVVPVRLQMISARFWLNLIAKATVSRDELDIDLFLIAQYDGLSKTDLCEWFFPNWNYSRGSQAWDGYIIHFTDFRYT